MYYNALGQRVLKAGPAQRIFYVYDEEGHTIGEYGQQHVDTVETVYLGDLPIAVLTPSMNFYVLADHIGAPLVLASPDGQIAWDWRNHDPFGNNAPRISTLLPGYHHRFPGQIADSETGLFYNYLRDYDPQTGRYIQSDPIGLRGGENTYAYVNADPVRLKDFYGLQALPAQSGISVSNVGTVGQVGTAAFAANAGRYAASEAGVACPLCAVIIGALIPTDAGAGSDIVPGAPIYHGVTDGSDPASAKGNSPTKPGRDCNGNCKPCPPDQIWGHPGNDHGSTSGVHYHGLVWNQNKKTCQCFPNRVSGPTIDTLR
jgi:RHS repeat-associated protein